MSRRAGWERGRGLGRRAAIALLALAGVASTAPLTPARADEEPAPVKTRLGVSSGRVTASFDVTSAFTEEFRRRLTHGLTSRVLLEMELYDAKGQSVAVAVRACQLRVDIWDEVLFVGVTDSDRTRRFKFVLTDDALRACGRVDEVPLGDRALLLEPSGYRLAVRVALNPVSPEVLDRTREFMANPRGTGEGGRPRAFFGAVARLFRSDAGAGGERFTFQSQALDRP